MDLILYDNIWYRSETKLSVPLLMANFNQIIRIEGGKWYAITLYGEEIVNGSAALFKMKLFTNGMSLDDLPIFYPMHTRWDSSKLYVDEFGDLIEEAVPAGEYHEN